MSTLSEIAAHAKELRRHLTAFRRDTTSAARKNQAVAFLTLTSVKTAEALLDALETIEKLRRAPAPDSAFYEDQVWRTQLFDLAHWLREQQVEGCTPDGMVALAALVEKNAFADAGAPEMKAVSFKGPGGEWTAFARGIRANWSIRKKGLNAEFRGYTETTAIEEAQRRAATDALFTDPVNSPGGCGVPQNNGVVKE